MTRATTLGPSKSQKNGAPRTHGLKVVTAALGALTTILAWQKKSFKQRPITPAAAPREVLQCWARVQQRVAAVRAEQEAKRLAMVLPCPSSAQAGPCLAQLPDITETARLHMWLTEVGKKQTLQEEHDRVAAWTRWVNEAWTSKPKELYSWLKQDAQTSVVMLEREDHTMTEHSRDG
jgi:hypothetical protein